MVLPLARRDGGFKLLAYQDPQRRASKRQKDLLDIMRLVEAHPKLNKLLPAAVSKKLAE